MKCKEKLFSIFFQLDFIFDFKGGFEVLQIWKFIPSQICHNFSLKTNNLLYFLLAKWQDFLKS